MGRSRSLFIALAILPLAGCGLGDIISFSCQFTEDSDHCYQAAAVQSSDPRQCERIEGKGFTGSNPPRDKCLMTIAENTRDYEVCEEIKGGFMSYSETECVTSVAVKKGDFSVCSHLDAEARVFCQLEAGKTITLDQIRSVDDGVRYYAEEAAKSTQDKNDPTSPYQNYYVECHRLAGYCKYAPTSVRDEAGDICGRECP